MTELLEAGFTVTLVGMSVVFVLLTLLVGIIQSMSYLARLVGEAAPAPAADVEAATSDDEIVGIISAAVRAYRDARGSRK
jgi:sodium pump decarboxylase gamma subunit